jgi:4-alpha-glucanotransferase
VSDSGDLRRLAALYGVAGEYWDIWGGHHRTSDATDRAILGAMGVPTAAPGREVARAELRLWATGLPGVVAVDVGVSGETALTVRREHIAERHLWSLRGAAVREEGELVPQLLEWQADGPDELLRYRWPLPPLAEPGYYELALEGPGLDNHATVLIAAPERCAPIAPSGERRWGVALQLYALRSSRNWGIGDFVDLGEAIRILAAAGADAIGLSPLHMLFIDDMSQISPYAPSSRRFLNPLYIDVEAVPEVQASGRARARMREDDFAAELEVARTAEYVDYARVAALKQDVLRLAFADLSGPRVRELEAFRRASGEALERVAVFQALRESAAGPDPAAWPRSLRDPGSEAVARFAREDPDAVAFHVYLQWIADEQLARAAGVARAAGMGVGLYGDLALGAAAGGADVWAEPEDHARGVGLGAPPDDFSPNGQAWGLPPQLPDRLRGSGIRRFASVLRACMRHMGAIRLDHVMGLRRLFWVVDSESPAEGTYVDYPFEELLAVVAVESVRQGCAVIGEDLGTVPDDVRRRLEQRGVLSYRVMWFEKRWDEDGAFLASREYPRRALATAGTHDLPTIGGFWEGRDVHHRMELGLLPSEASAEKLVHERALDRLRLHDRLVSEGLLPADQPVAARSLREGIHEFIARTPCTLAMVQIEDVFGELEQANLPGTTTEHPNWRRRLHRPIESWEGSDELATLAAIMAARSAPGRS